MVKAITRGKGLTIGLEIFQAFIGIGAVIGGLGLVLAPSGRNIGLQVDRLSNSPFATFLIPGIFLLLVIGIGNLVGSGATFFRYHNAGEITVVLGGILITWITAQVWWIGLCFWLQPLYFGFGVIELILGLLQRRNL
jgi:hypothetical protein